MNIFDTIKNAIPQSAVDVFVRTTDIASYMPGRVRLYSKQLVNNATLEAEERLRANAQLRRVEDYMRTHARRKAS